MGKHRTESELVYLRKLKAGSFYYGRVRLSKGVWKYFNTKQTDKRKAEAITRAVQDEIYKGNNPFHVKQVEKTVSEWVREYLNDKSPGWSINTLVSNADTLRRLEAFCGQESIDTAPQFLGAFRGKLKALSPHSQNIHLRSVKAFFRWVSKRTDFQAPDVPRVKAPLESEHDYLTEEEIQRLLTELDKLKYLRLPKPRPFVEFVLLTGMRRGEALAARREWIRDGFIRVPAQVSKTDTPRLIPITAELDRLLQTLPAKGLLFPDHTIEVSKQVKAALRKIGITRPLKFHNLRDTYIVRAIKAGVPLFTVARITGHDPSTLSHHYGHLSEEAFGDARRRLNFTPRLSPDLQDIEKTRS